MNGGVAGWQIKWAWRTELLANGQTPARRSGIMTAYQSDLLRLLDERGYIHQTTDAVALDALANKEIVPGYIGFDPTAPSLHVGSLVQIMLLRRLQQAGHKPIVLMGGGTGKIGDPSFKDEARKLMTGEVIEENIALIKRIFERFLTFGDGPTDAVMLDNAEWLDALEYIPFLRDVGQHFSINRMLSFDSVKLRLDREQSLSFLEFNYMILQAYDFMELSRRQGCRLQMGGSDQWGNIVNGIELARRMDGTEVFGVTTPLITTADGGKMGKTMSGAVWLHEDQLPAYDYWQFWRNTDDRDVGRFLRLFTDIPVDEIERLEALQGAEINAAKIALANAATEMCRGADAATIAAETARKTFEDGDAGGDLPSVEVSGEISLIDALVALNFVASKKEARRMIQGGGARINDEPISDENATVLSQPNPAKISAGKKKHGLLTFS
jgi:tyrosyl-tRNA synthetase